MQLLCHSQALTGPAALARQARWRGGADLTVPPVQHLCRAGILLLCLCPETESWRVRTARGEEPPANVLRSSYTFS